MRASSRKKRRNTRTPISSQYRPASLNDPFYRWERRPTKCAAFHMAVASSDSARSVNPARTISKSCLSARSLCGRGFSTCSTPFARLKHPRKRLRIVGSIDPSIENLLKTCPADSVDYLGNVPNTELAALYSTAHAFVLPSIEEGLAMVMAEAMACGCPVIASTHSGAEDLFTDGREGLIVPIRSSDAILHALQSLADQPEVARSLRAAARSRTQAMNGWNAYGRQWLDLLTTLTANGRATRPVAIAQHRESPAS